MEYKEHIINLDGDDLLYEILDKKGNLVAKSGTVDEAKEYIESIILK